MKDVQEHLERLRVQAVECEIIRDLATDPRKRELFARLADHHKVAAEIERAMLPAAAGEPSAEERMRQQRKTRLEDETKNL